MTEPRRFLWRGGAFGLDVAASVLFSDLSDPRPAPRPPSLPGSRPVVALPPGQPGTPPADEGTGITPTEGLKMTEEAGRYRRPVGVSPESGSSRLVVVCDDGSVWKWMHDGNRWEEMAPVPGTRHASGGR